MAVSDDAEASQRQQVRNADLGIAGLGLGALSLVGSFTDWVFLAVPVAGIGAILALIGSLLPRRSRGWGLAGFAASLVAVAVGLVVLLEPVQFTSDPTTGDAGRTESAVVSESDSDSTTITYKVVTDGLSVTHLSYVDFLDGGTVMQESLGVPPPFTHVVSVPKGESIDLSDFSVTGMGGSSSFSVSCSLAVNGRVVSRDRASGAYGLVNCMAPEEAVTE